VPDASGALHFVPPAPQSMRPAPEPPLTLPVPTPEVATVNVGAGTNVAVTAFADEIVSVQLVAVPEHAPDQPENTLPTEGAAVSVIWALAVSGQTQVPLEQVAVEPPDGPVTPPEPEPKIVTETCGGPKLAVTLLAAVIETAQTLFRPEHAPDQPLNTDPADGVAVR
jgi:hypothetical protein